MTALPRPVLMIPLRRCGSHALRLRLNFNPAFYAPYPLHIVDFMPLVPLYGNLQDDRAYFRLVTDVIGLQAASMVKWPGMVFDPVEVFEALRDQPRSVHRVVWELLLRAGAQHGARVVMDKSLDSVHYAAELMTLFPDMRFLNVVRDPRAQVASMNRAIIHDFDTLLNTQTWVAAHRAANALIAQYPERTCTIRYEDFLVDQESTLRRICSFLEIDFLPQMLDVSRSAEARQISRLSALWTSNCFAPITANIDKFHQQLSMDEITIIETLARDDMTRYGYAPLTAANAHIETRELEAARMRSEADRQTAWRALEADNYRDFVLRRHRADFLSSVRERLMLQAMTAAAVKPTVPHRLEVLTDPAAFEVAD
ncbi:sulfotransferase family protein [Ralstonia holmesii]|uniref:sulfotransferase family protein n=1 Tax=Ralstonia TaxID=48736 RepID=UPI00046873A7|nr:MULTISPECIES: sulfotransferase [Ralstonia]CAJ0703812.1 hypothetical protein R11007_04167 [Ralstonia sp. LMG 32967]